jgi:hypothetical protein
MSIAHYTLTVVTVERFRCDFAKEIVTIFPQSLSGFTRPRLVATESDLGGVALIVCGGVPSVTGDLACVEKSAGRSHR